jgi:hypothetical protein
MQRRLPLLDIEAGLEHLDSQLLDSVDYFVALIDLDAGNEGVAAPQYPLHGVVVLADLEEELPELGPLEIRGGSAEMVCEMLLQCPPGCGLAHVKHQRGLGVDPAGGVVGVGKGHPPEDQVHARLVREWIDLRLLPGESCCPIGVVRLGLGNGPGKLLDVTSVRKGGSFHAGTS